jgi:phospholipase C
MTGRTWRRTLNACSSIIAISAGTAAFAAEPLAPNDRNMLTPIKHVIVIYGENRTFDHLYATYEPTPGQTVRNLLSEGIVNKDGSPGPRFDKAAQYQASDTDTYRISPPKTEPYTYLPPPNTDGAPESPSDEKPPPFETITAAEIADYGLLPRAIKLLTTGATGLPIHTVDTRINNAYRLPNGPYQLTPGVPYDSYAGSPVHRFYQAWQQSDCSVDYAKWDNPSGCLNDLFPWVEVTIGAGSNGNPQPPNFSDQTTNEGAIAMGFYNVLQRDMPYFKQLSDRYAMSDNYHQPAWGGTGLNSIFAGFADAIWYSDGAGNPAAPPPNQIENPNPQPGTNNYYTQDGYAGGSYSACADPGQPGVGSVVNYLQTLPTKINPNCDPGHYYLLNNYNPGYLGNGTVVDTTTSPFTTPPSPVRSIGDVLMEGQVSFRWYGEDWSRYLSDPKSSAYCNICNPFQYQTSIMANASTRQAVNWDTAQFYTDVENGILPAVSFVKPSGLNDGHPASSKWNLFEEFTRKILVELRKRPQLWQSTAVLITTDEGGGYWDSGYIQPLDFFGDGPRIPLIVVSEYSKGGRVLHTYNDHVSILKFIETNWGLKPISARSRDNLPNPVHAANNPYVPSNSPAIGDLMDLFDFSAFSSAGNHDDGSDPQ